MADAQRRRSNGRSGLLEADVKPGLDGDALGRLQASLATGLVLTIVVGAAIRGPVLPEGTVPGTASGVLAVSFAILILQALVALVPARRQRA